MCVTNEGSVLGREESMQLGMSQVGSIGSNKFDHKEFNFDSFCSIESTRTAEEYYILFVYFICITAGEVD